MNNSDLFAAFASRIFTLLYENFPVSVRLPTKILTDEAENESELWELKRNESTVKGITELLESSGHMTPEIRERASEKKSALAIQIQEKTERLQHINAVLDGTVTFLLNEGFIRSDENGAYQLTLIGFVHLNKRFDQAGIQDGTRHIDRLVDILRPDKFSGAVTSGALASLVAKIFGG